MDTDEQKQASETQIAQIRAKIERGEELSEEEEEFVRSEGVELPGESTSPPAV